MLKLVLLFVVLFFVLFFVLFVFCLCCSSRAAGIGNLGTATLGQYDWNNPGMQVHIETEKVSSGNNQWLMYWLLFGGMYGADHQVSDWEDHNY